MEIFLNGDFVDASSASSAGLSPFDRGVLYGEGLFETVRASAGTLCFIEDHLRRLFDSAGFLGIEIPYSKEQLAGALDELLLRNSCPDAYVRITVTAGPVELGPGGRPTGPPTVIIAVRSFEGYPAELYRRGMRVFVSSFAIDVRCPLKRHKTLNYLANVLARREARTRGAEEALLLNSVGECAECSASNVFFVRGGAVVTPPVEANILPGITRGKVIDLCRREGIEIVESRETTALIESSDEMFLTNSLLGVMPVGEVIGVGTFAEVPGDVTAQLMRGYEALLKSL